MLPLMRHSGRSYRQIEKTRQSFTETGMNIKDKGTVHVSDPALWPPWLKVHPES